MLISLYCLDAISSIASLTPKPISIKALHPKIPITVTIHLLLYLAIFLITTFAENDKRFQIGLIRSSKIFLEDKGALGLKSIAGLSLRESMAVIMVTPTIHKIAIKVPKTMLDKSK